MQYFHQAQIPEILRQQGARQVVQCPRCGRRCIGLAEWPAWCVCGWNVGEVRWKLWVHRLCLIGAGIFLGVFAGALAAGLAIHPVSVLLSWANFRAPEWAVGIALMFFVMLAAAVAIPAAGWKAWLGRALSHARREQEAGKAAWRVRKVLRGVLYAAAGALLLLGSARVLASMGSHERRCMHAFIERLNVSGRGEYLKYCSSADSRPGFIVFVGGVGGLFLLGGSIVALVRAGVGVREKGREELSWKGPPGD